MPAIGKYFQLSEFLQSQTAARAGISMIPSPMVRSNLSSLVMHVLDPLRAITGRPIVIQSGYRPVALNKRIGGAPTSQHVLGQAADINCPGISPKTLAKMIVDANLPFDQLLLEFGSWVHVSYSARHRKQVLTVRLRFGQVEYTEGLV